MPQQSCPLCQQAYNESDHKITSVCLKDQSHLACRPCANNLLKQNEMCPMCRPARINASSMGESVQYTSRMSNNPSHSVQVQPQSKPLGCKLTSKTKFTILCILIALALVPTIYLGILRVQMTQCTYWQLKDCGNWMCCANCTSKFLCKNISDFQTETNVILVTVGLLVCLVVIAILGVWASGYRKRSGRRAHFNLLEFL